MYILAFDTYYLKNHAKTVCLFFKEWTDKKPDKVISAYLPVDEVYKPGEFYKRELPCIINILHKISTSQIKTIIIDGFVVLNDEGKLGLGGYLFEHLQQQIPVIGVAKNDFISFKKNKRLLYRGKSTKPLYITALGIDLDIAAEKIKIMDGDSRIPALLKMLDRITKENGNPGCS